MCYKIRVYVYKMGAIVKHSTRIRSPRKNGRVRTPGSPKFNEVMAIAEQEGLLRGDRTEMVGGRMPEALVARAKKRTGITSNTDLLEVALANIAVGDDYADWLLSRRGSVGPKADLEF